MLLASIPIAALVKPVFARVGGRSSRRVGVIARTLILGVLLPVLPLGFFLPAAEAVGEPTVEITSIVPNNSPAGTVYTVTARVSLLTLPQSGRAVYWTATPIEGPNLGQPVIDPPSSLTNSDGEATTTVVSTNAGTTTIQAASDGGIDTAPATWTFGPVGRYTVSASPSNATNQCFPVTVSAQDQYGNTNTTDSSSALLSSTSDDGTSDLRFHNASGCAGPNSTTLPITLSEGSATAYARSPDVETVTITAAQIGGSSTGNSGPIRIVTVQSVTVSPATSSGAVGQSHTVTATVRDSSNNLVSDGIRVDFTSSGTGSESPSSYTTQTVNGVATYTFTATRTGTSNITASAGSVSGNATRTWTSGAVAGVVLTPESYVRTVGTLHEVTATLSDQYGNAVGGSQPVTFTASGTGTEQPPSQTKLSSGSVATFTFTATRTGVSNIEAEAGPGVTDTASVQWTAAGPATLVLSPRTASNTAGVIHTVTATVRDAHGNLVPDGTRVGFTSAGTGTETPSTYSTDTVQGVATYPFTSTKTGTSRVTGTSGPGQDSVTASWTPGAGTSLVVTPKTATNTVGTEHTVTATVTDAYGNRVADGTQVTFTASGTGSETPNFWDTTTLNGQATYTFSATKTGTSSIEARSGSLLDTASKRWRAASPVTLDLQPVSAAKTVGEPHMVTATVKDVYGNSVENGTNVSFAVSGTAGESPSSSSVGTSEGLATFTFTSTKTGTSRILAEAGTASDASTASWAPGALATIVLSPKTSINQVRQNHDVTATLRDQYANRVADGTQVTFTVSGTGGEAPVQEVEETSGGVATFTFTSTKTGTSNITATNGSISDTARKTWTAGTPVTLDLVPETSTGPVGSTHTVTATVRDADGNLVADGTGVTFTATRPNASTVTQVVSTANGVSKFEFSATKTGDSSINAEAGGAGDIATRTWVAGPAASITVVPTSSTGPVGTNHTVTGTVRDQYANFVADGTIVTFRAGGTGGEDKTSESKPTANGQVTFTFTSTRTGTSAITLTVGAHSAQAQRTWTAGPVTAFQLVTDPYESINDCFTFSIRAIDVYGNFNSSYSGSVFLSSTSDDGSSQLNFYEANCQDTAFSTTLVAGTASVVAKGTDSERVTITVQEVGGSRSGQSAPIDIVQLTSLVLSPATKSLTVNATHQITATVRDSEGRLAPNGTDVTFRASGTGGESVTQTVQQTQGGIATFTFTSTKAGTTKVTGTVNGATGTATANWNVPSLVLSPTSKSLTINATHVITATVTDIEGRSVSDGTNVTFMASGTGGESVTQTVQQTQGGVATFTFTSTKAGTTKVTATVDGAIATATANWNNPSCNASPEGSASTSKPAIVRAGLWCLRNSLSSGPTNIEFFYGIPDDVPVFGDWDGNGSETAGVFRNGKFYLRNANSGGVADISFDYGIPTDVPIVGDWNGDGVDTIGIVREGSFYLRNSNTSGVADLSFNYGIPSDKPVVGDWNGDTIDTIGIVRDGAFYLRDSNSSGVADSSFRYGVESDKPVIGDWNSDGVDTVGITRGSTWYLRNSNTGGVADIVFDFGTNTDTFRVWR